MFFHDWSHVITATFWHKNPYPNLMLNYLSNVSISKRTLLNYRLYPLYRSPLPILYNLGSINLPVDLDPSVYAASHPWVSCPTRPSSPSRSSPAAPRRARPNPNRWNGWASFPQTTTFFYSRPNTSFSRMSVKSWEKILPSLMESGGLQSTVHPGGIVENNVLSSSHKQLWNRLVRRRGLN